MYVNNKTLNTINVLDVTIHIYCFQMAFGYLGTAIIFYYYNGALLFLFSGRGLNSMEKGG